MARADGATQGRFARHLPPNEIVEHAKFRQLIFRGLTRARRRARHACQVQRHLSFFRYAIGDRVLELRTQWEHGSKDLAQRRQVVIGDPLAKFEELVVEHGLAVKHADYVLGLDVGSAIVQVNDDA